MNTYTYKWELKDMGAHGTIEFKADSIGEAERICLMSLEGGATFTFIQVKSND